MKVPVSIYVNQFGEDVCIAAMAEYHRRPATHISPNESFITLDDYTIEGQAVDETYLSEIEIEKLRDEAAQCF